MDKKRRKEKERKNEARVRLIYKMNEIVVKKWGKKGYDGYEERKRMEEIRER